VLSTTSGTRYDIYPLSDGSTFYGFHTETTFSDGRAEYMENGVNWKGWSYWGVDDRDDGDLQFYFSATTDLTLSNDTVPEGVLSGNVVGTVTAVDQDDGETFTYELTDNASGRFAIDRATGDLTVADADLLNPAADSGYGITVRVTDGGGEAYEETFTIHIIWDDSLNAIFGTSNGDTLSGTSDDDYLAGGDGNDTLWGYGGNDELFGGSGKDNLDGGSGDDVMIGGIGADTIDAGQGTDLIIYESILDSADTINGFNAGQGHDIISLDSLLDGLGVATEDRASRIAVEKEGNVHTLKIDTSGDGLFDLMVATVNVINGEILNVRQEDAEVSYGSM
jgi:Ca2+-binding RTX toxin-like protein